MKEVVIVSAVRTPIGIFGGAFRSMSAVDLGVIAAKEAIKRAGISGDVIDELYIGNILSAGQGQNIARQVAIKSDIPVEKPATTLNILCGSGLKSVSLGAQIIRSGDADCILCGGTESMSGAPYLSNTNRFGGKMGDVLMVDSMIKDALTDAFYDYHMGITAENIADQWQFSRADQDLFALRSQERAEKAQRENRFQDEIVPVTTVQRKRKSSSQKTNFLDTVCL